MKGQYPDGWDLGQLVGCFVYIIGPLAAIGFWGGLAYVAIHFIAKYW